MIQRFFFLLLLLLIPFLSYNQTRRDLELNRKRTEEKISITNSLLENTSREREKSLIQLQLLNSKISLQKNLISDIENQISLVETEIVDRNLLISGLQNDLNKLKVEYSKLIRFAWKNRSGMQIIMFIFASSDFNQSYRRLRFYQQLIRFRQKQAEQIQHTSKSIQHEVNELATKRRQLAAYQDARKREVDELNSEQTRYTRGVKTLQQRERQLRRELEESVKAMEAISKAIQEMIAEEQRKAQQARQAVARDSRYLQLSAGFEGNRGKLPWPANPGVIVGAFGEHNHPVLRGVKVKNNGIDISTQPNAPVNAIFDGEVKRIVNIPGANVAVIIRHGDYLTVYSNLAVVNVATGDRVSANQKIGNVFTDKNSGRSVLNLQIWNENRLLNPKDWLLP